MERLIEMIHNIMAAMPQIARYIMAALLGWSIFENILHHGEEKPKEKYDGFATLFAAAIFIALLRIGGFW